MPYFWVLWIEIQPTLPERGAIVVEYFSMEARLIQLLNFVTSVELYWLSQMGVPTQELKYLAYIHIVLRPTCAISQLFTILLTLKDKSFDKFWQNGPQFLELSTKDALTKIENSLHKDSNKKREKEENETQVNYYMKKYTFPLSSCNK